MKKRLYGIVMMVFLSLSAMAQRADERVFVTTDRDWYAAGETVYLSAFCADVSDGFRLSEVSATAYVELASAEGLAVTGKVALNHGRGAGSLSLPLSLPTGNYRLCAYTRLTTANPMAASRIISVYNTLSSARVPDGVTIGFAPKSVPFPSSSECIGVQRLSDARIRLEGKRDATVSVSVFRNQPFPSYGAVTFKEALETPSVPSTEVAEYDGEVITLRLFKADGSPLTDQDSQEVLVSRPGHPGEVYAARIQPDGTARVHTGNLLGAVDLVVSLEENAPAFRVQVEDPFRALAPAPVPALVLDPSQAARLSKMGIRMQITSAFDADTLYSRLPYRSLDMLPDKKVHYSLDDYTRFATLQEVFTEYLKYIRASRKDDKVDLQVSYRIKEDGPLTHGNGKSLILVDGVPVLDHALVYNLDPSLVKAVDVYPNTYALGNMQYRGIANFITYKGDMGGLRFGDNVRILEFDGPSYPVAFSPSSDPGYPNERETLLWQPMLELKSGEECILPPLEAEEGLVLVVEGITSDGTPVYFRQSF